MAAALAACSHTTPKRFSRETPVSFVRDIAPILEERCVVCHHRANAPNCGGLNLETRQMAFSTGRNTPVIIPGNPDQSPLVAALLAREIHPVIMPPVAHRLSESQLELIQRWIREGANWPSSSKGTLGLPNS
jgi:hypothetical protein